MIRPPPRSTLFPTRRSSDLDRAARRALRPPAATRTARRDDRHLSPARRAGARRSEEHTSELQSHSDLVCRLLLEKKKTLYSTSASPCRRIPLCFHIVVR